MNDKASAGVEAGDVRIVIPPVLDAGRLRPDADGEVVRLTGDTMGTSWSLAAVVPPGTDGKRLEPLMLSGFEAIIAQMSQWEPGSELSRFNVGAPGSVHSLSRQFALVLSSALDLARASGGAFDPAVGALGDAWGFGAVGARPARPSEEAIAAARTYCWKDIRFDADRRELVQPGDLTLDLSAIAKGFAVDHAVALLEREGVRHALVEIGGELRAAGVKPDGSPWWSDIERAPGETGPRARIALSGWAVATTGHYLRRREAQGESWSHSIDPASGRPLADSVRAVSVLHPQAMQADGLATAIAVLGPEAGLAFADRHRLAMRMICDDKLICSKFWDAYCR